MIGPCFHWILVIQSAWCLCDLWMIVLWLSRQAETSRPPLTWRNSIADTSSRWPWSGGWLWDCVTHSYLWFAFDTMIEYGHIGGNYETWWLTTLSLVGGGLVRQSNTIVVIEWHGETLSLSSITTGRAIFFITTERDLVTPGAYLSRAPMRTRVVFWQLIL
jgi:hypothetical protein